MTNRVSGLRLRLLVLALSFIVSLAAPARAQEIWVAPTYQQDVGGLGIASNGIWPVTVVGAVRFAWAVPDDLQAFRNAKVVLIPHATAGGGTLTVYVCRAQYSDLVGASCTGPIPHVFTAGITNRLLEVDISAAIGPQVGAAGLNYLAVLAYTTPTTATDHMVGLRFAYDRIVPNGVATLGANTFSGTQTAPAFAGDGSGLTGVNASLLNGQNSAAFAAAVHGHNVSQVTNAATLGANTFNGTQTIDAGNLDLDGSTATTGSIRKNGVLFLHNFGTDNTFAGLSAGNVSTTGQDNTAMGASALSGNTTGLRNTAVGREAQFFNLTGFNNTALGAYALRENLSGDGNTAVGYGALSANASGNDNVAIGSLSGTLVGSGSDNIHISNPGAIADSGTIRIGTNTQTRAFIAGIRGVTTGSANGVPVVIDSAGQLGTVSSSRRVKEDIHDMADASRSIFALRPVTFRYTKPFTDGSKPRQYGLIAEEVAEVFPELAVRGADGEVETVQYQSLAVLLLNELHKQQQRIEALEQRLRR